MFLAFGNLAGNSIQFGIYILRAATPDAPDDPTRPSLVQLIAVAVILLCFAIHSLSRRCGIWLNKVFAITKLLLLFLTVGAGVMFAVGNREELRGRDSTDQADPRTDRPVDSGTRRELTFTGSSVGFTTALFSVGELFQSPSSAYQPAPC